MGQPQKKLTSLNVASPLLALLLLGHASAATAQTPVLTPSTATYEVAYRGIHAGTAVFSLRAEGTDRFVYESRSTARGLARLVVRHQVLEASTFTVAGKDLKPLTYVLDDGSSDTSNDTRLEFDWNALVAMGTHEDRPVRLPLTPGLQDRMSAQVLVMQQLAAGTEPGRIGFIDRDEIKEYVYTHEGVARLKTAIGDVDTVIYSSTREGSNRVSRIWYAPALGYTAVRAEQVRRGKVETVLTIQKLERS